VNSELRKTKGERRDGEDPNLFEEGILGSAAAVHIAGLSKQAFGTFQEGPYILWALPSADAKMRQKSTRPAGVSPLVVCFYQVPSGVLAL